MDLNGVNPGVGAGGVLGIGGAPGAEGAKGISGALGDLGDLRQSNSTDLNEISALQKEKAPFITQREQGAKEVRSADREIKTADGEIKKLRSNADSLDKEATNLDKQGDDLISKGRSMKDKNGNITPEGRNLIKQGEKLKEQAKQKRDQAKNIRSNDIPKQQQVKRDALSKKTAGENKRDNANTQIKTIDRKIDAVRKNIRSQRASQDAIDRKQRLRERAAQISQAVTDRMLGKGGPQRGGQQNPGGAGGAGGGQGAGGAGGSGGAQPGSPFTGADNSEKPNADEIAEQVQEFLDDILGNDEDGEGNEKPDTKVIARQSARNARRRV